MVFIPHQATDEEILTIVRQWIDVLASEDYAKVFAELGYLMSPYFDCSGGEAICQEIKKYRSPEFYPDVTDFKVTDWRTARGGNLKPTKYVKRYKPSSLKMMGAIGFDLPLNGKWSDLTADFVFFDNEKFPEGYVLCLEQIDSNSQWQREHNSEE
jgi:hypothetical protein